MTVINTEFDNSISSMLDYIKTETLTDEIISSEQLIEAQEIEIDDIKLTVRIEKV
jgi:hypothetical protein